jgi:hypothetical protein
LSDEASLTHGATGGPLAVLSGQARRTRGEIVAVLSNRARRAQPAALPDCGHGDGAEHRLAKEPEGVEDNRARRAQPAALPDCGHGDGAEHRLAKEPVPIPNLPTGQDAQPPDGPCEGSFPVGQPPPNTGDARSSAQRTTRRQKQCTIIVTPVHTDKASQTRRGGGCARIRSGTPRCARLLCSFVGCVCVCVGGA